MFFMAEGSNLDKRPFEQWSRQEKALGYLDFYRGVQRARIKKFEELLEFEEKFVAHEPIIVTNEVGGIGADDAFIANEQKLNLSNEVDDSITALEVMIDEFKSNIEYTNMFEREIREGDESMEIYYANLETERRSHLK